MCYPNVASNLFFKTRIKQMLCRRFLRTIAAIVLLATMTAQATRAEDESYLLVYKFETNQFVHYQVAHKTTIDIVFGQSKQTTVNESKTRKHFRVITADADTALLEPVIDHVRMTAQADDGDPIVFDSSAPAKKCPLAFLNILKTVGKPMSRVKFTTSGKLLAVIPFNAKPKPIGQPNSQQQKPANDPSRNFLVEFSKERIRVGERWSDDINVDVNLTPKLKKQIVLRRTYLLQSVEGQLATIRLKTAVLSPLNDPAIEAQLIQRTPAGTIVFDIDQGQIVSRKTKIDKVVINPFGPKSSMRAVSIRTERRLNPAEIASKPAAGKAGADVPRKR